MEDRAEIRRLPEMPATVTAERNGWSRSYAVVPHRVRELRPVYRTADPVSRTGYEPGELAQCDLWFPPAENPLGFGQTASPPVLVIVAGYSRWIMARMLPTRSAADLISGRWRLPIGLGAVPRALVWDNEGAVGSCSGWIAPTDRGLRGVRWSAGHPDHPVPPGRPAGKGTGRTGQRLSGDLIPARPADGPQGRAGRRGDRRSGTTGAPVRARAPTGPGRGRSPGRAVAHDVGASAGVALFTRNGSGPLGVEKAPSAVGWGYCLA